ncbi:MAG TPA: TRAP transporter large permease subunit [Pseudonocardiaceae bacterium]
MVTSAEQPIVPETVMVPSGPVEVRDRPIAAPVDVDPVAGDAPPTRTAVERVGDRIAGALAFVQVLCLLASGVVILMGILYRYVLKLPFPSSIDIETLLFGWLVWLGVPRAMWRQNSPKLGIARSFPPVLARAARPAAMGATIAYFVVNLWSYTRLFPTQDSSKITTLGIPYYTLSLAVPIGCVIAIVLTLMRLWRNVKLADLAPFVIGVAIVALTTSLPLPPQGTAIFDVVLLLLLDAPIAVALGVAGQAMIINGNFSGISAVSGQLLVPAANIALLAVPMFMLMGGLFANSRLARDLSVFVKSLVGWLPGGIGVATVATSAVFANVSGSAVADTAAIGSVYIPEMVNNGYKKESAAAVQAAAGVIGVIFPPAVAMIVFASSASISVVPVFEAVVIPGLLVALTIAIVAVITAKGAGAPRASRFSGAAVVRTLPRALPIFLIPLVLDGGIFSGVFTPSESGAVAIVVAAIIVASFRGASWAQVRKSFTQAVDTTTLVMFIMTAVAVLNYGLITSGLAAQISSALSIAGTSAIGILLLINVIFLVAHIFMETSPAILVLVPLVLPAALAAGVSPLQLAVVIGVNSTIGAIMPPVGVGLFVASQIAGVEARSVVRGIIPYVLASTVVLLLVTFIPTLSLSLPGWLS